jgi:DNA-binding CsgD family transcriptional regulator
MASLTPDLRLKVTEKIKQISDVANIVPGVIIIHQLPEFILLYMSPLGLELLQVEWNDIKGINGEEYHKRFFNEDFAKYAGPKIFDLVNRNANETVSYFQQVRTSRDREWDWYMSTTKILMRDDAGLPLLAITNAMRVDPTHVFTAKAAKLLEENEFLRNNHHNFAKLTKREKEILQLLALGKSAQEISAALNISAATADTHRKKIKQKLNAYNSYELSTYARAFDLI